MDTGEFFSAREIAVQEFNSLRGRLCTAIESAGLPSKQERALVLMIKNLSYQNQAVVAELIGNLQNDEVPMFRYNPVKLTKDVSEDSDS